MAIVDSSNKNIISKIKLPNSTEYTIKDGTLSAGNSLTIDENTSTGIRTIKINNTITSGSFGPAAATTPDFGETFAVPYVTVNAQGIATAIVNQTITMPQIEVIRLTE